MLHIPLWLARQLPRSTQHELYIVVTDVAIAAVFGGMARLSIGAIEDDPRYGGSQVLLRQRAWSSRTCAYINNRCRPRCLRNPFLWKWKNFRTLLTQDGHSSTRQRIRQV